MSPLAGTERVDRSGSDSARSYCTLFDKNYLYQAFALYQSLVRHAGAFRLYALCMDDAAFELIAKVGAPNLIPVGVEDLLTPAVTEVRSRTTHGQFCWVCQPLICEHVLKRFGAEMVTYLEADSLFFSSPDVLFEELGAASVSLVPHNFSPQFDNSDIAGMYCVQFNAFRNNDLSRAVLDHWKSSCFQYDRSRPFSYPGQTCLDDWRARFAGVVEIKHAGAGVAPWNVLGYALDRSTTPPRVDGVPVVFFHYHQYGRYKSGLHDLGGYPLTPAVIDCFYRPYVAAIREAERAVRAVDPTFVFRREYADNKGLLDVMRSPSLQAVKAYLGILERKLRGRYNVYPDQFFSSAESPSR